ncbi:hypothetical protein BLNAU_2359 [Blattamonas nauphoetae]|uniref:Uncharacterized protein n=1 Tax=Blattamonas nauphoetae TaxID=2049346 RepID=A0ABQ9YFI4_9EUKA|nr:hypothetical protein BLNAU_2359 [Blattamonas nauphoetae]
MELDLIYEALHPPLIIQRQKKPKQKERLSLCGGVNERTVAEVIEEAFVPIEEYDEEVTEDEDISALKLSCLSYITLATYIITERGMKVGSVEQQSWDGEAKQIAEMIITNKTITTLTLNNCKIGNVAGKDNEGAEGLANAFRSNKICQLTHLNISSNRMKDKGGMALSGELATNERLRHMNVASNDLNNTVNSLISTLRTNTCLQTVDFRFNDCSHILLAYASVFAEGAAGQEQDTAEGLHLLLIETQRECERKERKLLEQLDAGAKLVITLGDETKELTKRKDEDRKDGEFLARTQTTEANRRVQERSEAERKRKKTIRQLEDMEVGGSEKIEEMGLVSSYGVEAVGSVGSGQRVASSHQELRTDG